MPPFHFTFVLFSALFSKEKAPLTRCFQLVDKVIDKLPQAVEKDADFVISSP